MVEMAHIILYADEFDYAVWEEYCSICQESPSAISLRIPFNIFDVRATFDEENENEE